MVFHIPYMLFIYFTILLLGNECHANDILGCGGFVKSDVKLDFSKLEVGLYTHLGSLKEKTECAPTNGYYFLPLYEKGDYVLKVHPPPGWSIEPSEVNLSIDGSTDPCSTGQDINFSFNGFGITGNVITAGQTQGPIGVAVRLVNQRGEHRETVTDKEGNFHFTPVNPGKYTLKASHPKWQLDPASAEVQVSGANTALPTGSLAVKGYDVQGTVTANKNPISGVYVLLYSKKENNAHRVEGCNTALLQGVPGNPICHAVTDATGTFNFGLVPAGNYRLVPLAKQPGKSKVIYEIKPSELDFTVRHDSLYIENAFQVTGFTIIGRVVSVLNGDGLKSVQVLLNGQPMGVTDKDGYYTLSNLKANTYTLNFAAEQCEFSESSLTVSPGGSVSLSDAWPTRWRVCGDVTLASAADARTRTISLQSEQRSTQTPPIHVQSDPANGGKWCTFLASGVYLASVVVTDQERQDGLQFFPLTVSVRVGGASVSGVSFSQLRAEVGGAVVRLRAGPSMPVSLRALAVDGTYAAQPAVQLYTKDDKYLFTEVLPGSYEVSVGSESLCWASAKHNVAVTSAKAAVPDFVQTGYSVTLSASHDIEVEYRHRDKHDVRGKLSVSAGVSQQCLPEAGEYILTPIGCHQYQQNTISYNTDQDQNVIAINAVSHTNVIRVLVNEPVDDLRLKVIKDTEEVVGPLTPLKKKEDGYFVYEHTIMLAMGEVSVISAESSWVVWSGAGSRQLVGGGDCNDGALQLRGNRGVRLQGSVTPPIPGVTITLLSNGDIVHMQTTESDGKYNFGPLDANNAYSLAAEKDSYVLSGPDDNGNFKAHKLAEIKVTVVDESNGKPLQSALVSVSGGQYRRNLATGAEGALAFTSLAPAQYFVKPLMKEYRFTPPHTIVDVSEGQSYDVKLSGKRVACSAIGRVVWISGAGVGGAVVWARAVGGEGVASQCPDEEAVSEAEGGAFRVRGLHRGCQYELTLKHAVGTNGAPLKVAPKFIYLNVQSDTEDIEGLRLVAMERPQLTDVNILVYTPLHEHYKTLRIKLAPENEPSSVLYSSKVSAPGLTPDVNPGALYAAPRLAADNQSYVLQLDSTLSPATHAYTLQPIYFKSDGNFKQFSFQFLPKVKVPEQDMGQTPFMLIPGLIVLALIVYNKDKVLSVLRDFASDLADKVQKPAANKATYNSGPQVDLDESQIDQIVQNVNSVKKRSSKPKKI